MCEIILISHFDQLFEALACFASFTSVLVFENGRPTFPAVRL